MPQGCNLPIDQKDLEDIRLTLNGHASKTQRKDARAFARECLNSAINRPQDLHQILRDDENQNHEMVKDLLETAMEGDRNPDWEVKKLIPALNRILETHQELPGLFEKLPKAHGPGSSAMSHPYELNATAHLCKSAALNEPVRTSLGVDISIQPEDDLSFGYKYDSKHTTHNKGETIEGDVIVSRGDEIHVIDQKFTQKLSRSLHNEKGFSDKLERAATILRDGQADSFTYMTNREFHPGTKDAIFEKNCELIQYYSEESEEFNEFLTKAEQDNQIPPGLEAEDLAQDAALATFIIKSCEMPFIGYVEDQSFDP